MPARRADAGRKLLLEDIFLAAAVLRYSCLPPGIDQSQPVCMEPAGETLQRVQSGNRATASLSVDGASGSTMNGWSDRLSGIFKTGWRQLGEALFASAGDKGDADAIAAKARAAAPIVWLAGKVQSGKTSIVRVLTGCDEAAIGNGYQPCTRTASLFDFPAEAPVIRFLDTRGIGEAAYDPAADIAFQEEQSHLILGVMKAIDPGQEAIAELVRGARLRHPGWPVIVAQTCLHEGYARGQGHAMPYAYSGLDNPAIPGGLARTLAYQRTLFQHLPGDGPLLFVPLDFTLPGDGLTPADYGADALMDALHEAAPAGLAALLHEARGAARDALAARAHPYIGGYAAAAAAADAVPVAGLVAVPAIQAKMLHTLARIYNAEWDRRLLAEFGGCLGAGTLTRYLASFGLRELAKLIPGYGQTAGAAMAAAASFAATYALGKAAGVFLARRNEGGDAGAVADAYKHALAEAFALARARKPEGEKR
jgi:uncharacterized protein (DUF697 family)